MIKKHTSSLKKRTRTLHHPQLLRLPHNSKGRDFIVGDLHGMRELFLQKLQEVGFDPTQDRVICTGDLVDRGPDSLGTLKLLQEPWFYSTLGNHERILLAYLKQSESKVMYGYAKIYSKWVMNLSEENKQILNEVIPCIHNMPLVIQVDHPTLPYYVVHASRAVRGKILPDLELEQITQSHPHKMISVLTWSRRIAFQAIHAWAFRKIQPTSNEILQTNTPWEDNVSLTYVGHTVVPALILHRSHLFIDRGGCFIKENKNNQKWDLKIIEHSCLCFNLDKDKN